MNLLDRKTWGAHGWDVTMKFAVSSISHGDWPVVFSKDASSVWNTLPSFLPTHIPSTVHGPFKFPASL